MYVSQTTSVVVPAAVACDLNHSIRLFIARFAFASLPTNVVFASGSVNVFSDVVGQENLVNPFPVPPYVDAIICVSAAVPSKLFPYIALVFCSAVAVPALPDMVVGAAIIACL